MFCLLGMLAPSVGFTQGITSFDGRHYSYFPKNPEENLGDTFYRNNEFLRCEAANICEPENPALVDGNTPTPSKPKKFAYFLGRESDGFIVPVFIQCYESGSATASTAEDLVPHLNEQVLENGDCIDEVAIAANVKSSFVEDTLNAVKSYKGGCPKRDKSCLDQVFENFQRDLKNAVSIFKVSNDRKTETGCLSNLLSTVIDSLYQTLKLFVYDLPKGAFNLGRAGWNYFFGEEEEQSTSMLLSSVMSDDMATALSNWDLPKFYEHLKKNFFKFFGQIKEFYGELLGCTEWNGVPFNSQCLKKMNWSCPNCDHLLNFSCGLAGQLGAGFVMGGILGMGNSLAQMSRVKRTIGSEPSKFNLVPEAVNEMMTKASIGDMLNQVKKTSQAARFHAARHTRPIAQFFRTSLDDIRFILGVGDSFRGLIAATPVTMPYNLVYQRGKANAFKAMNEKFIKAGSGSNTLKLARAYAMRLDNISEGFEPLLKDLRKLRGKRFDPKLYKIVEDEYFTLAETQLKKMGMNVERLPEGSGLRVSKNGDSFDYEPNFAERLKNLPENINPEDMKKAFMENDLLMTNNHSLATQMHLPDFWRNIQDKAHTSRGMFSIKPDGLDGYVYLGQFSSQVGNIPQRQDCAGKLNGVRVLRSQEISEVVEKDQDGGTVSSDLGDGDGDGDGTN